MDGNELEQRWSVVCEARRWIATPYHHRAAVLGAGVDCIQLLVQAFSGAGLIDVPVLEKYSIDWMNHRNEEKYLIGLEQYATRSDPDETPIDLRDKDFTLPPGEIIVFRHGRTFSHGAIVSEWPFIIHAYQPSMIVEEVDVRHTPMSERLVRIYSFWGTTR